MTFEVIIQFMKNMRLYIVSIHIKIGSLTNVLEWKRQNIDKILLNLVDAWYYIESYVWNNQPVTQSCFTLIAQCLNEKGRKGKKKVNNKQIWFESGTMASCTVMFVLALTLGVVLDGGIDCGRAGGGKKRGSNGEYRPAILYD